MSIDMFLEVWMDGKKTKNYYLYNMDEGEMFSKGIKEVTVLPKSNEVKIEFNGYYGPTRDNAKSYVGVGLYKIVDD